MNFSADDSKPTGEALSLQYNERIYQFDTSAWFIGTVAMCDNCFGLRIGATETDVLSYAKSQKATVYIFESGKLIRTIPPEVPQPVSTLAHPA